MLNFWEWLGDKARLEHNLPVLCTHVHVSIICVHALYNVIITYYEVYNFVVIMISKYYKEEQTKFLRGEGETNS